MIWSRVLSRAFGRDVALEEAQPGDRSPGATAEEYWPDMAGLDYRDTVTDFDMPAGTFFDIAVVHLLTTATIDHLRGQYPQGRFKARRFRPNIVVSTGPDDQGFAENDWIGHTATIGGNVRLAITAPCPRCVMTTLKQGDLPADIRQALVGPCKLIVCSRDRGIKLLGLGFPHNQLHLGG